MNKFFKYLIENKGKIAYYLFVLTFYAIFNTYALTQPDLDWTVYGILGFFDLIALPIALYQPYKEWKDGL